MTKTFLRAAAVALGLATIYSLWLIAPLVSPKHLAIYHWSGPVSLLFLPTVLDLCVLWIFLTGLLLLARRPGRMRVAIWSGIILTLPWVGLKEYLLISQGHVSHWISPLLFGSCVATWLFTLAFWRRLLIQPAFERVRDFAATVLAFVGIVGVTSLCQLAWFAWQARTLDRVMPLHSQNVPATASNPSNPANPRVLWIVFDELSYQQVYEQRFPGLRLPAFDALAAQSTTFTHAVAAGMVTEEVMPALLTGTPVDLIRASSDGRRFAIQDSDSDDGWQPFDQHRTIFQDALNAGYSTGLAGWYNPYCRLLPEVLDRCFWTYKLPTPSSMVPFRSVGANMLEPLIGFTGFESSPLVRLRSTPPGQAPISDVHITDYQALATASDRLLEDRSINFTLLHLSIPHPAGIYDRRTGQLSTNHTTYIDNLALTDRCLAHIRALLERSGQWDSTAVVIMGDHSWRTQLLWASSPLWTQEEQAASHGGQFDDRPFYSVKMPGQQTAAQIDIPFEALNTRALLDGIMNHSIQSPADLSAWTQKLNQQRQDQ